MDRLTAWIARAALVFLYVPIVAVIVYSFNSSPTTSRWGGFGLKWYQTLFHDRALLKTLQTSLSVGLAAAAVATVVGFLSAFALVRYRVRGRSFFLGAVLLPLVLPEIVLGAALLTVFHSVDLPLGLSSIVLGHIVITLPLTTLILMGAIGALDGSLSEAAADLGCTAGQTFVYVLLPLIRSSLLSAFLLAFTTSFSNIVISTFTSGVGSTTMPLRIYSLLKTGITPEINALGAMLILATILVIAIVGLRQMRTILVGDSD